MTETHPLPALSKTALDLLNAQYKAALNTISDQTVLAMGFDPKLRWTVDYTAGVVRRDVPDVVDSPESPPDAPDTPPGV